MTGKSELHSKKAQPSAKLVHGDDEHYHDNSYDKSDLEPIILTLDSHPKPAQLLSANTVEVKILPKPVGHEPQRVTNQSVEEEEDAPAKQLNPIDSITLLDDSSELIFPEEYVDLNSFFNKGKSSSQPRRNSWW
ncbi:hypothetical protein ACJJTC_017210 [Scirpophaga incertulas]